MKLLIGAFPPELGPFLERPPTGWRVACTGVGAVLAAARTARLLEEVKPDAVLFLGTCGHYDGRLKIDDQIWAAEAIASSLSELRGEAYRPEIEETRWATTLEGPLPAQGVVVPPAITRTREGAALLGTLGAAEHLELTGVYAACHAARVKVGAALVVVNAVGPDAQTQWRANQKKCSLQLIEQLMDLKVF
ncbi:MAG TPA: phosphorylase [Holophagaceae bacterium]|jgi:nucleoside phosphorylase|nr:phosphorylase [Holophagaceae bacterium]